MTGNDQPKKYVIVHGHFYQPPRENPWINRIERQPSASPHHDWNERIYDQCYRPNAYSRLLDSKGMIVDIYNNYLSMSFNFGPTLFSWLEQFHPVTARRIIESDAESCRRFGGHGNAIAQVYNHIIMPLASRRDQFTQIRWSKHFFQKRFGRDPEGMWLAETAINMETVNCLIEENIKFVILSPSQAECFRPMQENAQWISTVSHGIDTRRTYRIFPRNRDGQRLPGHLDVFFFDEGLSKEVSFGALLKDAHILGNKLRSCYDESSVTDQVVTIATDGETFGHHKPFGDMCLAYFFKNVASKFDMVPVNFGYFLEKNPPQYEVNLKDSFGEGTAWSCAHGVGRWKRDCGCQTGGESHWKQTWRGPMRDALTRLQEKIDNEYQTQLEKYEVDPWKVRDKYITISGEPSIKKFKSFLEKQCGFTGLDRAQTLKIRRLLEAQKYSLFSFTSCGWFFSDISGIESIQNLAYACRALQLGLPESERKAALESFLADLEKAPSNLPNTNGRTLFEKELLSYFEHGKIMAFSAAIQKTLGIKKTMQFELFGYAAKLDQVLSTKNGALCYDAYNIELENESNGECDVWSVLVVNRSNSEITGWVLPSSCLPEKKSLRPEIWMGHAEAKSYKFADTFVSSQHELTNFLLHKITKDTDARFSIWMKKNEKELALLSGLSSLIPEYCKAPLSFVYQEQWNRLMARLETCGNEDAIFAELLELTRTVQRFGIPLKLEGSAVILEKLLILELNNLAKNLKEKHCDRIRFFLNLVDRFSIPVYKHKLEDIFNPILNSSIHNLYLKVKENEGGAVRIEDRELLLKLLSFARRMNFNTDAFELHEK